MSVEERLENLVQAKIVRFQPAQGGYTAARRGIVSFGNGKNVFLKASVCDQTARWLRTEYTVYRHLGANGGTGFLPTVLAWDDDGVQPILLLEDLSQAHWPPPWRPELAERVCRTLALLRSLPPMHEMPSLESYREDFNGWHKIALAPEAFLSLGLCSPGWLAASLPALQLAEKAVTLAGDDFLHLDIRSDNLCFTDDRTILVDWNWACVGNGLFDLAAWLPSLYSEGGPSPESILPDAPELAAALSGFWAARAGLPRPEARQSVLISQLRTALPWAARALGLDEIESHY